MAAAAWAGYMPPGGFTGRCWKDLADGRRCEDPIRGPATIPLCDFHKLTETGTPFYAATGAFWNDPWNARWNAQRGTGNAVPSRGRRTWSEYAHRGLSPRSAARQAARDDRESEYRARRGMPSTLRCNINHRHQPGCYTNDPPGPQPHGYPFRPASGTAFDLNALFNELWNHPSHQNLGFQTNFREIGPDYVPEILRCRWCQNIFTDPQEATEPTTGQTHIFCQACAPEWTLLRGQPRKHSWRERMLYGARGWYHPPPYGTKSLPCGPMSQMVSAFKYNFDSMIRVEAPRQICRICNKPCKDPVITCPEVPPLFWNPRDPAPFMGKLSHAFCLQCLRDYKSTAFGGRYVYCPAGGDSMWDANMMFEISQEMVREGIGIAGRAWEKTLVNLGGT